MERIHMMPEEQPLAGQDVKSQSYIANTWAAFTCHAHLEDPVLERVTAKAKR